MVKVSEIIAKTNGHIWRSYSFRSREIVCCEKCGVIRRSDDKNNPCKGKVKIALR